MSYSYAYLSQGQLHLKLGDDPVRPIDSKFGESVRERAAQINKGGGSCIAVMRSDGTDMRDVTQGDTIDDAPHWAPGSAREIVFQSSAIGRNRAGFAVTQTPFAIYKLDLETGTVTALAEDPKFDLLTPQLSSDGSLYYIRRPYRDPNQSPSPWRAALDLILLPFRLFFAVFQFLNFFTMRYTGNTLTTTGNARQKHADIRKMMIWGNMLDADKAADRADDGTPALVPKSWELVGRRKDSSTEEILAKGVLSYDLYSDGTVLYSNGSGIYRLDPKGSIERLTKDSLVEQVVAVEE